MAHTNSTTNYSLPQFLSTDKPAWLTDVNPAYSAIDTGMHNAQTAADAAQADATQALDDAAAAAGAASTADAKASGAVASFAEAFDTTATYSVGEYVMYNNLLYKCNAAVVTPGPWTGSSNWERVTVDSISTDLESSISNIKIEDLSNVTITSSDNNKILGVSVSGDNISVNAVDKNPVSVITAITNDATGISDNDTIIARYGNLIIMSISFTLSDTYASQWKNVFTFDDTSLTIAGTIGYMGVVSVENSVSTYGQIYTNNGHITYRVRNPEGSRTYRGQLIFPVA